jgi:hypothetical protein
VAGEERDSGKRTMGVRVDGDVHHGLRVDDIGQLTHRH